MSRSKALKFIFGVIALPFVVILLPFVLLWLLSNVAHHDKRKNNEVL